jgi:hypothetical protein
LDIGAAGPGQLEQESAARDEAVSAEARLGTCYPTSVPETTFTTIEIHMAQDQLASSAYRISGQAPANLVVKCPQPVAKVPVNPALFAAPTPVPAAKATPVSTKKP